MEAGSLVVSRTSDRDLKIRGIEVLLDGKFVGDLLYGKELVVPLEAGPHTLKVTNRFSSKTIEFESRPGETVRFEATGVALGGIWFLMTMLGTVAYKVRLARVA